MRRRWCGQGGFLAIEYAFGVAVLLIPVGLFVITAPSWPERQEVARVAAAEAARNGVQQSTLVAAESVGEAAARQVALNYGVDPTNFAVTWTGDVTRGNTLTAHVQVRMPALQLPGIASVGAWYWHVAHSEQVDQFRSYP
jgi:hypothetical protein